MKKWICGFAVLAVAVLCVICIAAADDDSYYMSEEVGGVQVRIEYSFLEDGSASFDLFSPQTLHEGDEERMKKLKKYKIPNQIDGRPVTRIGFNAFGNSSYNRNLETIILPDTVTDIDGRAFAACHALKSIRLPEGLKHLGYQAFSGNYGLKKITFPESLVNIDGNPFSWSTMPKITISKKNPVFRIRNDALINEEEKTLIAYLGKKEEYSIEEGITGIAAGAFSGVEKLTKLTIPDSVRSIGKEAFSGCNNLASVRMPKGLEEIGDEAFSTCWSLLELCLPEHVSVIGVNPFKGCCVTDKADNIISQLHLTLSPENRHLQIVDDALFSVDDHRLVWFFNTNLKEYTVPDGTLIIGRYAFINPTYVDILTISDSVTCLEPYAVYRMRRLHKLVIGSGIKVLGMGSVCQNTSLITVVLSEGLEKIENSAISTCENLKEINFPRSLKQIDEYAFYDCPLVQVPETY